LSVVRMGCPHQDAAAIKIVVLAIGFIPMGWDQASILIGGKMGSS